MYSPYVNPANRPYDITPPAFGDVGGGVQNQEVLSTYDIWKPNELIEVFERHSYAPGFRLMLRAMGFNRGTAAPTTGHYEYPWRKDLVRINSIITASTGPGTSVVVELTSDSMFDTGVTVGGAARKGSYPVVNDILQLPDGNKAMITAKNVTTDPHRLTLTPTKAAVDLVASVVAGEAYFISDRAMPEGSGLPSGRTPRVMKYTNEFQIVKEACAATGSEMTNETYFRPIPGREGSFYLQTQWSTMYNFEQLCDGALIFGQTIDNITQNVSELGFDVPVKGTEGLIDFGLLNGYTVGYTPGALSIGDFDAISRLFEQERLGVRQIMAWDGFDIFTEKENALQTLLNADITAQLVRGMFRFDGGTGIDELQPIGDADLAVNIGFYALKKAGYIYSWKLLHVFNEYMGAGAPGYDYTRWSIYHPLGYVMNKATGQSVPTIGYEYKQLGNYSRENVVADISGVGVAGTGTPYPIATNVNDIHKLGYLAEIAFHGTCANHLIIHQPS